MRGQVVVNGVVYEVHAWSVVVNGVVYGVHA